MDRDGTEDGYELELTRAASRRRGRAGDRLAAAPASSTTWSRPWSEGGADAVLCASIFHYGQYTRARGQGAHARRRDPGAALAAARRDAARGGGGDDRRAPPEREDHETDEGLDLPGHRARQVAHRRPARAPDGAQGLAGRREHLEPDAASATAGAARTTGRPCAPPEESPARVASIVSSPSISSTNRRRPSALNSWPVAVDLRHKRLAQSAALPGRAAVSRVTGLEAAASLDLHAGSRLRVRS